jgi:hypothetical protein
VRILREFELPREDAIIRKEGQRLIIEPAPPKSLLAVLALSLTGYDRTCQRSLFLPRARLFCVSTISILVAMAGVSVPTVKRLEAADGLLGGREDTGH